MLSLPRSSSSRRRLTGTAGKRLRTTATGRERKFRSIAITSRVGIAPALTQPLPMRIRAGPMPTGAGLARTAWAKSPETPREWKAVAGDFADPTGSFRLVQRLHPHQRNLRHRPAARLHGPAVAARTRRLGAM